MKNYQLTIPGNENTYHVWYHPGEHLIEDFRVEYIRGDIAQTSIDGLWVPHGDTFRTLESALLEQAEIAHADEQEFQREAHQDTIMDRAWS